MQPAVSIEELLTHRRWLAALARSLVADADEAREIEQDTWLAALSYPPKDRRNLKGWLARLAVHGARRRWRRRRFAGELDDASVPAPAADPAELAAEVEVGRSLAAHVLALDEPFRTTVLLRYWHGLDAAEIARRDQIPASTVRWRLKRGLDELRSRLQREHGSTRAWALQLAPLARLSSRAPLLALAAVGLLPAAVPIAAAVVLVQGAALFVRGSGSTDRLDSSTQTAEAPAPSAPDERRRDTASLSSTTSPTPRPDGDQGRRSVSAENSAIANALPVAWVHGRVLDDEGRPITNATLHADRRMEPLASVDREGRFELALTASDLTSLNPTFDGAAHLELDVRAPYRVGGRIQSAIREGDRAALPDVRLAPGGAVQGIVLRPDGAPLTVPLVGYGGSLRGCEPDGTFLIDGVPVGTQTIEAKDLDDRFSGSLAVTIEPGRTLSGLVLRLAASPRSSSIEGTVLHPDGSPAPHAWLHEVGLPESGDRLPMSSDAQGLFVATNVGEGTVALWATGMELNVHSEPRPGEPSRIVTHHGSPTVHARAGDTVTLQLTTRPALELRLDSSAGRPLRNVEVYGVSDDRLDPLVAFWILEPNVPVTVPAPLPGQRLRVTADGHAEARSRRMNDEPMPRPVHLRLRAAPHLEGRVVDQHGQPIVGATIHVSTPSHGVTQGLPVRSFPRFRPNGATGPDGHFAVPMAERGAWFVQARSRHHAAVEVGPLETDGRRDSNIGTLVMTTGGSIEGVVRDAHDRAKPGAIVVASRGDGFPLTRRSDDRGAFAFDRLTPGPWHVAEHSFEILEIGGFMGDARLPAPTFNTSVDEGRTTRFDVEPVEQRTRQLQWRLFIDDTPAERWAAFLELPQDDEPLEAVFDDQGWVGFEFPDRGGLAYLAARSPDDMGLFRQFDLATLEGAVRLEMRTGELVVENVRSPHGAMGSFDGWMAGVALVPAEGETVVSVRVPAGRWKVVSPDDPAVEPEDFRALVEGDVVAGTTTRLRLP